MVEYLNISPVGVQLGWRDDGAASLIDSILRYLHAEKAEAVPEASLCLDIQVGLETTSAWAEAVPLGTFDNGFAFAHSGEDVLLWRGDYLARLNFADGKGTVRVPEAALEGPERWVACAVVLESLIILLRRHHLYSLHAAALVCGGRGCIIAAPADSGKSTLAFRLVQSGWAYLSDDIVLLHPTPAHVGVHGLRSHFSLDPDAETIFPELAAGREASLLKEEKWAVNVEALYPRQRVAVCVPHVLLFPHIIDGSESTVSMLSPVEALRLLLAQSSLARTKLDGAEAHLNVLSRLARRVPAYRLHAGRDLLEDERRAAELLAPLVSESEPVW